MVTTYSNNIAAYVQGDKKVKSSILQLGCEWNILKLMMFNPKVNYFFNKDLNIPFQPVFRVGGTYQPMEYTFIRGSYGQGYRFPSIAEKYIQTFVGGLNIFPNAQIRPEYGWSGEIGIKQDLK